MAAPIDADWADTAASDAALNATTHGSGTTAERTAISSWPANRPFFDTDLVKWFFNVHASAPSSITWQADTDVTLDSTESSSTQASGASILNATADTITGRIFQLPTTFDFYIITATQIDNNTSVGNIKPAVYLVDGTTPTTGFMTTLCALGASAAQSSGTQKMSTLWSKVVKGGSYVFAGALSDTTTTQKFTYSATSQYYRISTPTFASPLERFVATYTTGSFNVNCGVFYKGLSNYQGFGNVVDDFYII